MSTEDRTPEVPGGVEITRVRYDGVVLNVSWHGYPNPSTTYVINVSAEKRIIAAAEAGHTMNGWLPVDLLPDVEYTVAIEERRGNSSHGWSQDVDIVLATTAVTSAETDPATGTLVLATPGPPDRAYRLRLVVNGAPAGPDTDVEGERIEIAAPQPPGCLAAVTLAIVVDSNNAVSIGPHGPAFAIPSERPDLLAADFDGTTLTARWTPVTGATGYRLTVLRDGVVNAQADVGAPATEGTLAVQLSPGSYTAVVQAVHSTGSGPASAPLALVLAAPAITAVTCDGATLALDITPPPGVTPSAYEVSVVAGGVPVVAATVPPGSPLRVPVHGPLAAGTAAGVSVRARVGLTTGPEVAAPAVLVPAEVASVVCSTDLLVTALPGRLPSGSAVDAVLYVDGTPGRPQRVAPDGTTTFPIPSGAAAVAARGVDGIAIGPWSGPVPAPTRPPVFTAALAGADRVDVAWTGTPGATYRAALGDITVMAQGTTTGLPLTEGAASVTEVAGVASGPTVSVDVVAEGPALSSVRTAAGRKVTVRWTAPAEPALTAVQPVVRWDGTEMLLSREAGPPNPLVLILPEAVPNAATLALRGVAGVAVGPPGSAAALLTSAPAGLAVSYDGATVVATWEPLCDPAVDRYAVGIGAPGENPSVVVVPAPPARIAWPNPMVAPVVTVAAMVGEPVSGPTSAPVGVLIEPPAITRAVHDGTDLRLEWDGSAPTYQVAIESGGVAGQVLDVGGKEAVLPLAPGQWTGSVRATGECTLGVPATVPLLTAAPVPEPVAFDAVSGDAHLVWPDVPGAGGYTVAVLDGTDTVATQDVTDPECTLPAATFTAGGSWSVTVRATAGAPPLQVAGPDATVPLRATPPAGVDVAYDGTTVRAWWDPAAGASGYRVATVSGGNATTLGDTSGPAGAWALSTTDLTTTLVVQPLDGTATGAPSAPAALFPAALAVGRSYIAPQAGPALVPATIELLLPQLFATPPTKVDGLPLGLTLTGAAAPYAWTLTIPASSPVWTFTNRTNVPAAWVTLVTKLQSLTATPYGIAVITEAVSRAMPQTFAETLYFAYGLQFTRACIDLRPGVVLRVEYEGYQTAPGAQTTTLSGYVATAVADYEVASYDRTGTWTNGLDAFLAGLTQGVVVPDPGSSGGQQPGGGGGLDAFTLNMQTPFVRLVYPPTFLATTSAGSAIPQFNALLLGSQTVAALETATDQVRKSLPPGAGVAKTYFRGRTVVRALVRILVDDVPRLVPIGTTVGNVLAAVASRPPTTSVPLQGVTLHRPRAAAVTADGPRDDWVVRLDWSPGDPARLDLPLLHGDRLDIAGTP